MEGLSIIRQTLGKRQYRVARLVFGRRLTQLKAAEQLRMNYRTVKRDVAKIRQTYPQLCNH